jgi:hypothetical protein
MVSTLFVMKCCGTDVLIDEMTNWTKKRQQLLLPFHSGLKNKISNESE